LYFTLAAALSRRTAVFPRSLVDSFVALGAVFATLAIPLAFDARWTGAAWAMEGAGLVWLGVRHERPRRWLAGCALQLTAALALFSTLPSDPGVPLVNAFCLGAVMVSGSAFFSAWQLQRAKAGSTAADESASIMLLGWSLMWWFLAAGREISNHVVRMDRPNVLMMFAACTAVVLVVLRSRLSWRELSASPALVFPMMMFMALNARLTLAHPSTGLGGAAWLCAIAAQYYVLHRVASDWPERLIMHMHQGMLLLVVFLASWELSWHAGHISAATSMWRHVGWIVVPGVVLAGGGLTRLKRFAGATSFKEAYWTATIPLSVAATLWLHFTSVTPGNPAPMTYLPLLNPLELMQCLVMAALLRWLSAPEMDIDPDARGTGMSIIAFVVLNGIVARATHMLAGVDFTITALWASPFYQSALSMVWTIAALVLMLMARRQQQRGPWYCGALLLTLVVIKLFAVDLDDVGTVARIVSFLVVGLLMLVMGYLSPLPPRLESRS
jgi:uncharacterized membrane protein